MAALRPALAMLSRGPSAGSSAVAYMGGRGLEVTQVFRHTAPPAPLLPAATRNLGCRRFSTEEPTDKAKNGLLIWWQLARNRVKNAGLEERARVPFVYTVFVLGAPAVLAMKAARELCHP